MTAWEFVLMLAALVVADALLDVALWLWQIRPRLDRLQVALGEAVDELHCDLEAWMADQNLRIGALTTSCLADPDVQGGRHERTGHLHAVPAPLHESRHGTLTADKLRLSEVRR